MQPCRYILTFLAVLAGVLAIAPTPARAYTAPSPWLSAPTSTTAGAAEIYDYDDQATAEKPHLGLLDENALDWRPVLLLLAAELQQVPQLILVEAAPVPRYRFQGREYDEHAGSYYYRLRTYLPEWGSFTGPDMKIDPWDPFGQGNYVAFANNPLVYTDPLGLELVIGGEVVTESSALLPDAKAGSFEKSVLDALISSEYSFRYKTSDYLLNHEIPFRKIVVEQAQNFRGSWTGGNFAALGWVSATHDLTLDHSTEAAFCKDPGNAPQLFGERVSGLSSSTTMVDCTAFCNAVFLQSSVQHFGTEKWQEIYFPASDEDAWRRIARTVLVAKDMVTWYSQKMVPNNLDKWLSRMDVGDSAARRSTLVPGDWVIFRTLAGQEDKAGNFAFENAIFLGDGKFAVAPMDGKGIYSRQEILSLLAEAVGLPSSDAGRFNAPNGLTTKGGIVAEWPQPFVVFGARP